MFLWPWPLVFFSHSESYRYVWGSGMCAYLESLERELCCNVPTRKQLHRRLSPSQGWGLVRRSSDWDGGHGRLAGSASVQRAGGRLGIAQHAREMHQTISVSAVGRPRFADDSQVAEVSALSHRTNGCLSRRRAPIASLSLGARGGPLRCESYLGLACTQCAVETQGVRQSSCSLQSAAEAESKN